MPGALTVFKRFSGFKTLNSSSGAPKTVIDTEHGKAFLLSRPHRAAAHDH